MSQKYQDVLDTRQDALSYDATQIAQEAGVPWRTAQAWRAGLVVDRADAAKCEQAARRLQDAKVETPADAQRNFNARLDGAYKAGGKH